MKVTFQTDQFSKKFFRFKHLAMNTVFEIFMVHEDPAFARSAAYEAFLLLDRLEEDLSRFKENSDVARLNQLKVGESVVVSQETFECLQQALELYRLTNGLFDVGAGLLFDFFKEKDIPQAPLRPGSIQNLQLDAHTFTVHCLNEPLSIDLGGVGKGFALDKMKDLLMEWEVENALLHGGYSSVLAFGTQPWPLSFHLPSGTEKLLLKNGALGASGLEKGTHIVNPRTGQVAEQAQMAWVLAPQAALADALSTTCLLWSKEQVHAFFTEHPELACLVVHSNVPMKTTNWPTVNS